MKTMTITIDRKPLTIMFDGQQVQIELHGGGDQLCQQRPAVGEDEPGRGSQEARGEDPAGPAPARNAAVGEHAVPI